ncbi:hypothetical protein OIO90_003211 [Microbotryomycetes sp. JL221]|nr:hypothetical protein OIO90_003211 [Microbotryomycetes sp. JL221]
MSSTTPPTPSSSSSPLNEGSSSSTWTRKRRLVERVGVIQHSTLGQTCTTIWRWKRSILFGFGLSYALYNYQKAKRHAKKRDQIHDKTYLYWKLYDGGIVEAKSTGSNLNYLLNSSQGGSPEEPPRVMTLFEVVRTLKFIEQDDRIHGIIADFSNLSVPSVPSYHLGLAQLEEIQEAMLELKRIKKQRFQQLKMNQNDKDHDDDDNSNFKFRTIAWTDSFHSQVFDEVYTQPTGEIPLVGMGSTTPFFGKLIKWLGIHVHAEARNEYKSFVQPYIDEKLTPPQKQNQIELINDLNNNLLSYIAKNRIQQLSNSNKHDQHQQQQKIDSNESNSIEIKNRLTTRQAFNKVKELTKEGPFTAQEAIENGLIDGTCYKQDIIDSILVGDQNLIEPQDQIQLVNTQTSLSNSVQIIDKQHQEQKLNDKRLMGLYHYSKIMDKAVEKHIKDSMEIGVVYLMGTIGDTGEFGTAAVVKGLKEAAEDDSIGAVVLRIDSGGGGVIESDTIWGAIKDLREKYGKTVVASFGNASASGGYLVSTHTDAIIAAPSTVTGSIGVASLRPTLLQSFFDKFFITLDSYFTGSRSQDLTYSLSSKELKKHSKHVDDMYLDFKQRVIEGRGIHKDLIDLIAGGRVMTGLKAFELNAPPELIKQIKGLDDDDDDGVVEQGLTKSNHDQNVTELNKENNQQGQVVELSKDQEFSPFATTEPLSSSSIPMSFNKVENVPTQDSAEQHAQQALSTATIEELNKADETLSTTATGKLPQSSSTPTTTTTTTTTTMKDKEEKTQEDKEQTTTTTTTTTKNSNAGVYQVEPGPFGRGLIDGIGGIRDAAVYACEIFISNGIAGYKQLNPDMSDLDAVKALMPDSNWQLDDNGALTMQMDVRLKRFPIQKTFWQQVQEANARGDSIDLNTLKLKVKQILVKSLFQFMVTHVVNEFEEMGMDVSKPFNVGKMNGSGLGLGSQSRRGWMRAEWSGINLR